MSKSDEVPSVATHEHVSKRPRRRRCLDHCRRFWWAHLIVFIILAVVLLCILFFVAIPKIAQSKIDAAQLTIQGIVVTNTQAQNYSMAINSTITSDGSVHATIDAFTGDMYLEDWPPHVPFAQINFPQTTSDALVITNITQPYVPVTNLAEFTRFNTWLLVNDSLKVTVTGNTFVHVSGISKAYPVTFTKTVEMPGLRNFVGTNTSDTSISVLPDKDGNDFKGYVQIPNYSLVTFELGNTSFYNYLNGQEIGTTYVDNMILRPGIGSTNNFSLHANISQSPVLKIMSTHPYCEEGKGIVDFQLRGKDVVNHGQHLAYYADALGASNQTLSVDIGAALKAANISLGCSSS